MRVLITGQGGREAALRWKLAQSPQVTEVLLLPKAVKKEELIGWTKDHHVDLVIVSPDDHLAAGWVDLLESHQIKAFGPTQAAAEIEWSKSFAKNLMIKAGVPTAQFATFHNLLPAQEYLKNQPFPLVIKADGLALGKGVIITNNLIEAEQALINIFNGQFGNAGKTVVIEEFLEGQEISIHVFCDGTNFKLFPASQDHKRIFDNDEGPNTGGMGTIAPVPWVTTELMREVEDKIIKPILEALKNEGREFKGVLYPGLIITKDGPKVIEFNSRFGDPETQSYMRLLETDLLEIILACVEGTLDQLEIKWRAESACCVVLASGGYPDEYQTGFPITGLDNLNSDIVVFPAGMEEKGGQVFTSGGRVLGITATGHNLQLALNKAYQAAKQISFPHKHYRTDIGKKSLK